jgi:tetratricopeptide (TPR) repeat protein
MRILPVIAAVVALGVPARAQQSDALRQCTAANLSSEQRLAICTAVIEADQETWKNLAIAYDRRGIIYFDRRDYDRALADFDEAAKLDPTNVDPLNGRGRTYLAKGQFDRAIAEFDLALALNPGFAIGFNNRGIAYQNKGEADRAIADYNQAIELRPEYSNAFANRGRAYQNKGNQAQAAADYDRAIELDPKNAFAFLSRGNLYLNQRDYDRAIADLDRAIALRPGYPEAVAARKLADDRKGQAAQQAMPGTSPPPVPNSLPPAQSSPPEPKIALFNQGITQLNLKDYDRAIASFDEAIKLDPMYTAALNSRGFTYEAKGQHDRAIADYDQAIGLDPKFVAAFINRGMAYGTRAATIRRCRTSNGHSPSIPAIPWRCSTARSSISTRRNGTSRPTNTRVATRIWRSGTMSSADRPRTRPPSTTGATLCCAAARPIAPCRTTRRRCASIPTTPNISGTGATPIGSPVTAIVPSPTIARRSA